VSAAFAAVVLIGKKQLADTQRQIQFESGASGALSGGVVSTSYGGRLKGTARLIAEQLAAALTSVVSESGLFVQALDEITVLARNDKKLFELRIAGEMRGRFETANEAILAGLRQQLLGPEFVNELDPIVQQVVRNFDGLAEDLGSAMGRVNDLIDEARGFESLDVHLSTLFEQIKALRVELESLGVSRIDAQQLSGNVGLRRFEAAWQDLAGIEMSPEQLRQQAEARRKILISELELYRLETQMDIDALTARAATVGAEGQLVQVEIETWRGGLRGREIYVRGTGELIQAELAILQERLKAIDELLGTIKTGKINIPNLGANFAKGVDKFGGLTDRWERGVERFAEAVNDARYRESTTALTEREQLQGLYQQFTQLLLKASRGDVSAVENLPGAYTQLLELAKTYTGGGGGLAFLGAGVDNFRDFFALLEGRALDFLSAPRPSGLHEGDNVIFDERFHRTAERSLATQEAHRTQAREDSKAVTKAIRDGFDSLKDTVETTTRTQTQTLTLYDRQRIA
jgi:hypothetical protein